jgi:ABC-type antimicrobial peptide transport system permease subunit
VSGWTVVVRGIRYRSGRSLIVLLLAAIATAATVLAPAYSRAAQQSVLADRLATAPLSATSLHVRSDSTGGAAAVLESTTEAKVELRQMLNQGGLRAYFEEPVGGADVDAVASTRDGESVLARMAFRDGACRHLTITDGQCPAQAGDVMVSERSAREYSLDVGQRLGVQGRAQVTQGGATAPTETVVTVVGIYTPRDAAEPYWGRGGYFAAGAPDSESALPRIDAVFVADEQDLVLPGAQPSIHLDYRLTPGRVSLDDVATLQADLASFETAVNAAEIQLITGLRQVLDDVGDEVASLGRTVPMVAVPLVLVCWFVVFLLVAALTDERGPEVALAKLRGYSPRQATSFGRGEVMLLVALAAPIGVVLALGIVEVAARALFRPGINVEIRTPVAIAALAAVVVGLLVVRAASARSLARPVLALLRRVPERGSWRAGVAEAGVIALAAASLVAAVSDQTAPLALLAPAMLAVVAGIVTARLLGAWSRMRVRRHARKGRVSGLLAHAQLSRRSLGHRVVLVVTVAVALLSFAATAWDVAAQARRDAAQDMVGADRVLLVGAANPDALVAAVSGAAPGGVAMPVVRTSERYDGGIVDVVGVAADQLADVAVWRGHDRSEVEDLARGLRSGGAGTIPVALTGPTPDDDPTAPEFTFPGLGDTPQRFSVSERYPSLPRTGERALLFDLDLAVRAAQSGAGLSDNTRLRYEVWANDAAPADLAGRLAAAGLQILGDESIAAESDRLARGAPALGLGLYLIAGAAAVLLAVGAVLLTTYIGGSTRRYELAALRVAGVRPGVLRRGLLREYAHLLGLPFLVGLAVGIAGAALMLPGIPLVTVGSAVGEFRYVPGPGALPVAVGATLLGLAFAIVAVLRQVRRATPEQLREGGAP